MNVLAAQALARYLNVTVYSEGASSNDWARVLAPYFSVPRDQQASTAQARSACDVCRICARRDDRRTGRSARLAVRHSRRYGEGA